ncbi:tetratricopeptide repeat protein [Vallitalea pronyensis]|uniref:Tetratricopeptide repeat protein n=1 Tax=Vallitalea pronyensis TaxID=1348613 RepID=A0A8J8MMZ0_9FIRM|nr:tetratricopeptide repeat protein [Vallitalea pronyensis]QUI24645.1 tetratricopeptide repeat protein [Vallitalea pronyensis]
MKKIRRISTLLILLILISTGCGSKSPAVAINEEGYKLYISGDYQGALEKYNEAITADSSYSTAYANRGMIHFYLGKYEEALADMNKAIEVNPKDPVAYSNRGYFQLAMGQVNEALKNLDEAIALKKNFDDKQLLALTYVTQGSAYGMIGAFEKGIASFDEALAINKNDKTFYNAKGILLKDWEKYDEAIEAYNEAITIDQSYAYAYGNRGFVFFIKEEYTKALADVDTAIEIDASIPQVYNTKALIHSAIGEKDTAIEIYDYMITRWPHYNDAYIGRGNEYLLKEDFARALTDFSVAASNGNLDAMVQKGYLHMTLEQYEDGLQAFKQYNEVKPNNYLVLVEIGNGYQQLSQYEESITYYDQAIEIDPQHYLAYYSKGLSLKYQEKYEEALDMMNLVLTKHDLEEAKKEIEWIEKKRKG